MGVLGDLEADSNLAGVAVPNYTGNFVDGYHLEVGQDQALIHLVKQALASYAE